MKFQNVRVFFAKFGDAKYISHLDLYRAFGRAVKRSGLPVWVTEGFNPHIYTTFALPLALGIESREESVDLRFTESVDFAEAASRLNAVMPAGLSVSRVAEPIRDANDIERAKYTIRDISESELARLNAYFGQDVIEIVKKSKSKTRILDVKPHLEWEVGESGAVLTLPAGNLLNISPWNVLEPFDVTAVTRTAILCKDGGEFA
jgi:radical SAM-linked protein